MIHYHGTPITPRETLLSLAGRFFCVSFVRPDDVDLCHRVGQGVMLDNGAFSVWRTLRGERADRGRELDWDSWREWAERWLDYRTSWAVLPDAIDAGEEENDRLLERYRDVGRAYQQGVPVWHLDEPLARLGRLTDEFSRVCFGSAGVYAALGTDRWHQRASDAFDFLADEFGRVPPVHMLRGMAFSSGPYPFASADSTDIARNHNRPQNTARAMAERWDAMQPEPRWRRTGAQLDLEGVA